MTALVGKVSHSAPNYHAVENYPAFCLCVGTAHIRLRVRPSNISSIATATPGSNEIPLSARILKVQKSFAGREFADSSKAAVLYQKHQTVGIYDPSLLGVVSHHFNVASLVADGQTLPTVPVRVQELQVGQIRVGMMNLWTYCWGRDQHTAHPDSAGAAAEFLSTSGIT